MQINLGDNYKIRTDGLNAIVSKKYIVNKKVEEGQEPETEEVFKVIGYYCNIKYALSCILNNELLEDEVIETIEDLIERIDHYSELVKNLKI